ncbi:MAG: CopD family protein [Anaerolineae bacterium]
MPREIIATLIVVLHDLFTAAWVGGLLALGLAVMPAARDMLGMGPGLKKLMDAIQRRLRVLVYVSIVGLWVTGMLLARRTTGDVGLFSFASPYTALLSIKHLLVLAMVVVALMRSIALPRREAAMGPRGQKVGAALLYLNMVLGIAVVAVTGFLGPLTAGG